MSTEHNLEVVEQFFNGPRDLDRLSLMSDDCEWFNGIGKFPAAPGVWRGLSTSCRVRCRNSIFFRFRASAKTLICSSRTFASGVASS